MSMAGQNSASFAIIDSKAAKTMHSTFRVDKFESNEEEESIFQLLAKKCRK